MVVIDLEVSQKALRRIQREAKKWFPREMFAALIGIEESNKTKVIDIWVPADLDKHTGEDIVYTPKHWVAPANEYAEENDMKVVGSVHSHPFSYEDSGGCCVGIADPSPSSGDWETTWWNICGITSVVAREDGRLRTRTRFYGPAIAVQTTILKVA